MEQILRIPYTREVHNKEGIEKSIEIPNFTKFDLVFRLIILLFRAFFIGVIKGTIWDIVYDEKRFQRVFHDQIFSLLELHTNVDDAPKHSPGVVHIEGDLAGKLTRFELLGSENNMLARVTGMHS